ncbi:carbohydrate ABC transporter permease [Deinococcus roseus]|uniref:ABC transporter permease n=1 Tax=Deinococcus roseus TaxID=392414 RepID=A0ABQ2D2A1_9DEIO|nr:carbohydrate ABC transporter permease [Deinococcus roseus]GGJ43017.1 ABC transporter permease [Deinococcus roseus]
MIGQDPLKSTLKKKAPHNPAAANLQKTLLGIPATLLIVLIVVSCIYPVIWIFMSSFKGADEFLKPMWTLPQSLHLENYTRAWTEGNMGKYVINSALVVFPSIAVMILLGTGAAFGLEVMRWKLSRTVNVLFLIGIMVPIQIVILPLFNMYYQAHLLDTRFALILTYVAFGLPLVVFFLSGYFQSFPREIVEAAVVDGASIYQVFFKIALPMVQNAIVTVALVQFFFLWNDLLVSLTFTTNPEMRTVQSGLLAFTGQYGQREWGPTFASISMAVAPTVLIYLFLNRMVMKGMAAGAVKG